MMKYSMLILNLRLSDKGEYACHVENTHGVIWGNFSLQVIQDEGKIYNIL